MLRQIIKPFDDYEKRKELGKEVLNMMVDLEKRGERITELIHNVGSLRLVTIAEKPSFEEIKRARDLTQEYIELHAIHVNMLIPQKYAKKCKYCSKISLIQQKYLIEIRKEFKSLKVWESNRLEIEPIDLNGLRDLAREVYGNDTAERILYPTKNY
jgi:anion-transporting  ArsA/GET3 family ATPase